MAFLASADFFDGFGAGGEANDSLLDPLPRLSCMPNIQAGTSPDGMLNGAGSLSSFEPGFGSVLAVSGGRGRAETSPE